MMTPREKLRICLMFGGIVSTFCGIAVSCAEPNSNLEVMRYRFGAWKDGGIAGAVPKEVAPWLFVGGVLMLVASFMSRER